MERGREGVRDRRDKNKNTYCSEQYNTEFMLQLYYNYITITLHNIPFRLYRCVYIYTLLNKR